jgi:hypothetical protein
MPGPLARTCLADHRAARGARIHLVIGCREHQGALALRGIRDLLPGGGRSSIRISRGDPRLSACADRPDQQRPCAGPGTGQSGFGTADRLTRSWLNLPTGVAQRGRSSWIRSGRNLALRQLLQRLSPALRIDLRPALVSDAVSAKPHRLLLNPMSVPSPADPLPRSQVDPNRPELAAPHALGAHQGDPLRRRAATGAASSLNRTVAQRRSLRSNRGADGQD